MLEDFRKSKLMVFPRNVLVGHGVLDQVGSLAQEMELAGEALVVTGPHTRKIAGDAIAESLAEARFKVGMETIAAPTRKEVDRMRDRAERFQAKLVVGVGGGSVIDVAKLASAELHLPFLSVPTSASHDGITSPRASIKDGRGSASVEAQAPIAILADTSVIVQAPYRMLAAGCADAISNKTAVLDWKLAHRLKGEEYSSFAAALSETAADIIVENAEVIKPGLEEAVWVVVKGLIVSGVSMSVAGSSRPASGAEHMISHALDRLAPGKALHGEQCGIGAILTMYLHGGDWKQIRDALKQVGAPTSLKELGIPNETMVEALTGAHEVRRDRYTILGDNGLSKQAAQSLIHKTGVDR